MKSVPKDQTLENSAICSNVVSFEALFNLNQTQIPWDEIGFAASTSRGNESMLRLKSVPKDQTRVSFEALFNLSQSQIPWDDADTVSA